jgi:CRISPR-associated protein Csx16
MTDRTPVVWLVTRHAGAREFARRLGLCWQHELPHAEDLPVQRGDKVYGTLPYWLAAHVCESGAEFWCLEWTALPQHRGVELSADELEAAGARFVRYDVRRPLS